MGKEKSLLLWVPMGVMVGLGFPAAFLNQVLDCCYVQWPEICTVASVLGGKGDLKNRVDKY